MNPSKTIARARAARGMSLGKLARIMSVGRSTVHRWETSGRAPPSRRIPLLSEVLGISVEKLVGR